MMLGKDLMPEFLIAITHADDAAVPLLRSKPGSFEGQMRPRI